MKKIIVIGCPGSGKSTFSRKLHDVTGIELYHLDLLYWNEDRTTVTTDVFQKCLLKVINKEEWIIDGNYSSTMEQRLKACDTVFFLDYPTDICLEGIKNRKGKPRSDMPWVGNEDDEEFIELIRTFPLQKRPEILNLLNKYHNKNIYIFKDRSEAERYLEGYAADNN